MTRSLHTAPSDLRLDRAFVFIPGEACFRLHDRSGGSGADTRVHGGAGVAEATPPASLGRWFPFATCAEFAWVALEPDDENGDCSPWRLSLLDLQSGEHPLDCIEGLRTSPGPVAQEQAARSAGSTEVVVGARGCSSSEGNRRVMAHLRLAPSRRRQRIADSPPTPACSVSAWHPRRSCP